MARSAQADNELSLCTTLAGRAAPFQALFSNMRCPSIQRPHAKTQAVGCAQAGGAAFAYPPASLEKAVMGAFLAGAAGEAAWQDKLALLLYLLADAGIADLEAFRCDLVGLLDGCDNACALFEGTCDVRICGPTGGHGKE